MIMLLKTVGIVASSLLLLSVQALATPQPIIEELLTANRTLGRRIVAYPEGTPEMHVYRITIPVGAKIPLHIHPSPVVVIFEQGRLSDVRIVDGVEVSDIIEPGDGFLGGHPEELHYVINRGSIPGVSSVTFASVVGMPNQISVKLD